MKTVPVGSVIALVDDEDYDLVSQFTWTYTVWNGCGYAKRRNKQGATVSMHALILKDEILSGHEVDHIDGNGLNNQKNNLRAVYHKENLQNQRVQARSKSGYRGVTYFPKAGKWDRKKPWRARIKVDGNDWTIGYFKTPEEAALAWNKTAYDAWGDFARLNVVPKPEERR